MEPWYRRYVPLERFPRWIVWVLVAANLALTVSNVALAISSADFHRWVMAFLALVQAGLFVVLDQLIVKARRNDL